jgi:Cu-Zn family superoxide dismutase
VKRTLLLAPLLLAGCAVSMGPPATKADALPVSLFDAAGTRAGTATLTADATGLTIVLDVRELTPGVHTVRLHEHGLCERPDFLSAGTVVADIKEVTVGPDGRGQTTLRYHRISGLFVPRVIFGGDGTALIIGDSSGSARLACGIVI